MKTSQIALAMSNGDRPEVRAYVFGDWAAHVELVRAAPGRWARGKEWRVTAVPNGRSIPLGLTPSREHAIGLARALGIAKVSGRAPNRVAPAVAERIKTIAAEVASAIERRNNLAAERDRQAAQTAVLDPMPTDPEVG